MDERRDWKSDAYRQARTRGEEAEAILLGFMRLVEEGVVRHPLREKRARGVDTKSERLKRVRRAQGEVA